jgi:diaminohydroxyphosphoribosylaminopyrimidine deaminase/5-amino-6-(5-phosphoribosylamino)uracil reductase
MNYLQMALEQAFGSVGISRPNPAVGAVVVKDGIVVGRGATQSPGNAHAEVMALRDAGECARGAAIYVTLEPCCHYGRTPPCTKAIIEAGISEVYYAHADPNPQVRGKSRGILEAAGIKVYEGADACLRAHTESGWDDSCSAEGCMTLAPDESENDGSVVFAEIERFFEAYDYFVRNKRTFVEVKVAVSENGFMGMLDNRGVPAPLRITGQGAACWNHELRAMSDAILVGAGTLLADNPSLDVRYAHGNSPVKVLWAGHHELIESEISRLKFFSCENGSGKADAAAPLVFTCVEQPSIKSETILLSGETFEENWTQMVDELSRRGMHRLMVEPGAHLSANFFAGSAVQGKMTMPLWNRLDLWKSTDPSVESRVAQEGCEGLPFPGLPDSAIAKESAIIGPDVLTVYYPG